MKRLKSAVGQIASTGLAVLAPLSAGAQTATGPPATPGQPSAWRLEAAIDAYWSDNLYFTPAGAQARWGSGGRVSLGRSSQFQAGSFGLTGFAGTSYYPEAHDLSQVSYGGSAGVRWKPSARTGLDLTQTYTHSNTLELRTLDPDLPIPASSFDATTSTLGLTQQLSSVTSLALSGSFGWRRYGHAPLVGGKQVFASARLTRTFGADTSLFVGYGYSGAWLDRGLDGVHTAGAGVSRRLGRRTTASAAAGIAYLEYVDSFYPTARLGLQVQGRQAALSVSYGRDFGQAFGYGRSMIADIASAAVSWRPAQRLGLFSSYSFAYRQDPTEPDYKIVSRVVTAGLGWNITRGLTFGGRYSHERNETTGAPELAGNRVAASLSYSVDWR